VVSSMQEQDKTFEVRFYLTRRFADAVRQGRDIPSMKPLKAVLEKHGVTLQNQLDEFQDHLKKWQEIQNWADYYPDEQTIANEHKFEKFTLNAVLDDRKREYLSREFSLVKGDKTPFSGLNADGVVADLEALGPKFIGTGPRMKEPKTRKIYSDNGGPHAYATGIIPEKKIG